MAPMHNRKIPPIAKLAYKKGELIIKEGDYGIAIYKIIKGQVQIFNHSGTREIILARLGPGEVIGEMALLSKEFVARSASARAVQDSELEVWHPALLSEEYDKMPLIIRHMIDETRRRLARMNKLISQMSTQEEDVVRKTSTDQKMSGRLHYRKEVDLNCIYRPVGSSPRLQLNGRIRNISLTGINMVVRAKTAANFSHDPGDEFNIELMLPNGNELNLTARIQALREPPAPGTLSLGMVFTDMREGSNKQLGFFLMP